MDRKAMYKLSYGLFILTAKEAEKDNGCIINTAIQAASEPNQLSHSFKVLVGYSDMIGFFIGNHFNSYFVVVENG